MSKRKKKLSTKDLLDFTSNLSLLLNSGLSLHNSINMINSFTRKKQLKEFTEYLDQGLKKGSSLSQLIEKENFISLPLYRGLINIGDRIGSLASILPTLQTYLERKKNIRD
ncbi:MAG: type II secretion system F family protein, partial [Spirochaetaceae bacterium]|nr:type II secretion system F family protein [Spirochaetaceae bacterium]